MKKALSSFVFVFIFTFGISVVYGCSCVRDSVKKRYKKAEAVFIGQVARIEEIPEDDSLIQGDGVETLKVIKSWKGIKKEFVMVNFNLPEKNAGMCFDFSHFDENKKYLIFAYKKDLKIETVCSDTMEVSDDSQTRGYNIVKDSLKKLDSFGFRLW